MNMMVNKEIFQFQEEEKIIEKNDEATSILD